MLQHQQKGYAAFIAKQLRSILVLVACLMAVVLSASMQGRANNSLNAHRDMTAVAKAAPTPDCNDPNSTEPCHPVDDQGDGILPLPIGLPGQP